MVYDNDQEMKICLFSLQPGNKMFAVTAFEQIWNTRLSTGEKMVFVSKKYNMKEHRCRKKQDQQQNMYDHQRGLISTSMKICTE